MEMIPVGQGDYGTLLGKEGKVFSIGAGQTEKEGR